MSRQSLEKILPLVQHPSHYLGGEIHARRKDPKKVRLRLALAFPDLYPIGMSHVGIQILYHILNAREEIAAERVFAPGVDLEERLRNEGIPLASLESGTPLCEFDIVGFSLLYELNYTGILNMLSLSGIPFYGKERDRSHPFVIAGGPCTFNPEPVAEFFDAMVVGDGEDVVLDLARAWLEWREGGEDRKALLKRWSGLQGVYVPSFFDIGTDSKGFQVVKPLFPDYKTVRKSLVSDLKNVPYPDHPVVPFGTPVHDRISLEICRGCTRGCRFCQAGMIYRPVRERSCADLLSLAERSLASTGHDDISLLSLSTGDYSRIEALMEALMNRCAPDRIAVSLPSLRVGSLTASLMNQIKRVRKTGFTVAPEAGSQRLRQVINKNITEEDLEETVRNAFDLGWKLIKLYFMIGLPTETDDDLDAIINLARRLQRIRSPGGRGNNVTVSVSTFIPKAHTPFQWCPQVSVDESRRKIDRLRDKLRGKGLRFKWQHPEMSLLEGLWARGDRRLCRLLVKAYQMGCRLDGWSDHFDFKAWQEAIEACGIDVDFYTTRIRDFSEPLPWDHIDSGVSREFLEQEWENAIQGRETPDCRGGECGQCGVCDFERVKPITFEEEAGVPREALRVREEGPFKKFRVHYEKRGLAAYFGHLEMVRIFIRAFRRARIPMRFSQGFHPQPKISFEVALPVGTESFEEQFTIQVPLHVSRETFVKSVNAQLPEGLNVTGCHMGDVPTKVRGKRLFHFTVTLRQGAFSQDALETFLEKETWPFSRTNGKGRTRTLDLRPAVKKLVLSSGQTVEMILEVGEGAGVRPKDVLQSVFSLPEETIRVATILKRPVDPSTL
jgi:radical SAM family uncharacterized protein/radical SAM-linked protein